MFRFKEYIEKKRLDEEQQERDILKEKKLKALAYETQDAGWIALEGNPELVSEYVKHITRNNNK